METLTLEQILNKYCAELVTELKAELERNSRKASGKLINTIQTKMVKKEDEINVILESEDYFTYINNGRQPSTTSSNGQPLKEKILEWIKEKNITPQPINGILPSEKQLAYLIARKIHNEGYEGDNQIYSQIIQKLNQKYLPLVQKALNDDLTKYVRISLSNIIK